MGLGQQAGWHQYYWVLGRAKWSAPAASRLLLGQLVARGSAGLRLGRNSEAPLGATHRCPGYLPRCRAQQRFSSGQVPRPALAQRVPAHASGLGRSQLGLTRAHRAGPSAGWATAQGRRHKKVTDWARQAALQLARWLPGRQFICRGASGYAVLALLATPRTHATWLTLGSRACAQAQPCMYRSQPA